MQDFAHLMIACLRAQGLRLATVSGYLLTVPPPRPRALWSAPRPRTRASPCGAASRLGRRRSHQRLPSGQTATSRFAWGGDFSDVTPMRGVILGGGEQELEVSRHRHARTAKLR